MAVSLGSLRAPQPDFSATSFKIDIAGIRRGGCTGDARSTEEIQAESDGIFSCSVSELVGEGLKDPRKSVAAGRAKGVGGNAERHEGSAEEKVLEKRAGELVAGDAGGGREFLAFPETDEMISPGDEFA